jgi:hypothetical protein
MFGKSMCSDDNFGSVLHRCHTTVNSSGYGKPDRGTVRLSCEWFFPLALERTLRCLTAQRQSRSAPRRARNLRDSRANVSLLVAVVRGRQKSRSPDGRGRGARASSALIAANSFSMARADGAPIARRSGGES